MIHLCYIHLALIIIGVCMFIWIKKSLDIYYKNRIKDRNNEFLEKELEQIKQDNKDLSAEIYKISQESHKINHKLNVLTNIATDMVSVPAVTKRFKKKYTI